MVKVIFACVHNAGRSQMASALFNKYANPNLAISISAGTEPAEHVHPEVIDVMNELGIDLSTAKPILLTDSLAKGATHIITMGCGEQCPHVPGLIRKDWPLQDPKGKEKESVRQIRDQIKVYVLSLLNENGWSNT